MTRMSKFLALGMVASTVIVAALVLAPAGRAAVTDAPQLKLSYSVADVDHALGAFDAFRNRLDGAPRQAETGQTAAIQGDRAGCAQFAWPHIPPACQTAAAGRTLRQVRTVSVDVATR
ncbi:hypothetical protein [Phreatobacter sp.]|uniref:hypothetical protein n=1 Tax=Phreatobacter sp. TaxID=1966341 RepID=UPI003F72092C